MLTGKMPNEVIFTEVLALKVSVRKFPLVRYKWFV